jgi:hypothetical protein
MHVPAHEPKWRDAKEIALIWINVCLPSLQLECPDPAAPAVQGSFFRRRASLAKAHREIAVSIRPPRGGDPRTSLAKAHREIAVSVRAPARGRPRTSLTKAHREIAVSTRAPRAGATDTNYSGYGTDCALKEKAVSPVIGRREYIMSKPDGAIESGAKG